MSNIIEKVEKIMSEFLDGIEAKIKKLTGNHGIDNSHLNADIKAIVAEALATTVTPDIQALHDVISQQEADIADLKTAINDAVDHLSEDNNDAATQVLKTAVEEIGAAPVETAKTETPQPKDAEGNVIPTPKEETGSAATTGELSSSSTDSATQSGAAAESAKPSEEANS